MAGDPIIPRYPGSGLAPVDAPQADKMQSHVGPLAFKLQAFGFLIMGSAVLGVAGALLMAVLLLASGTAVPTGIMSLFLWAGNILVGIWMIRAANALKQSHDAREAVPEHLGDALECLDRLFLTQAMLLIVILVLVVLSVGASVNTASERPSPGPETPVFVPKSDRY